MVAPKKGGSSVTVIMKTLITTTGSEANSEVISELLLKSEGRYRAN